jgi:hypothetical protein
LFRLLLETQIVGNVDTQMSIVVTACCDFRRLEVRQIGNPSIGRKIRITSKTDRSIIKLTQASKRGKERSEAKKQSVLRTEFLRNRRFFLFLATSRRPLRGLLVEADLTIQRTGNNDTRKEKKSTMQNLKF